MSDTNQEIKYICFIPTGGMNHMLGLLSSSILLAKKSTRMIFPMTSNHGAFGIPFDDVFDIGRSKVITQSETAKNEIIQKYTQIHPDAPLTPFDYKMNSLVRDENNYPYYTLQGVPEINGSKLYLMDPEVQGADRDVWLSTGSWPENGSSVALNEFGLKPEITERCISLHSSLPSNYIACHYRNTDYKTDFFKFADNIRNTAKECSIKNLFIATDDISSVSRFKEELVDYTIYSNPGMKFDITQTKQKNSHYASAAALSKFGMSKLDMHAEFFAEIYCCVMADIYIPNPHSSIRHMVKHLRDDKTLSSSFFGVSSVHIHQSE